MLQENGLKQHKLAVNASNWLLLAEKRVNKCQRMNVNNRRKITEQCFSAAFKMFSRCSSRSDDCCIRSYMISTHVRVAAPVADIDRSDNAAGPPL